MPVRKTARPAHRVRHSHRTTRPRRRSPRPRTERIVVPGPARARASLLAAAVASGPAPDVEKGAIRVGVYDGTRQPWTSAVLVRLIDGTQQQIFTRTLTGSSFELTGLAFHDNFIDRYDVVVSASHRAQAGFSPVILRRGVVVPVDLMLLPQPFRFAFDPWDDVVAQHPRIADLLRLDAATEAPARERYGRLALEQPPELACLLNLATAMSSLFLRSGTPLAFLKSIEWNTLAQDRFFGWADREIVVEIEEALHAGTVDPEPLPGIFHPGATRSVKQKQFGEANVQLTLHENDTRTIGGVDCIRIEPDIDYYRDPLAHSVLEVMKPGLTDPATVYVLRWIAGRQSGQPNFAPPYRIVDA